MGGLFSKDQLFLVVAVNCLAFFARIDCEQQIEKYPQQQGDDDETFSDICLVNFHPDTAFILNRLNPLIQ